MKHNEDAELHYSNSNFYLSCKKEGRLLRYMYLLIFLKWNYKGGQTAVGLKYLFMKDRGWGGE